jgi:hypothetical protein
VEKTVATLSPTFTAFTFAKIRLLRRHWFDLFAVERLDFGVVVGVAEIGGCQFSSPNPLRLFIKRTYLLFRVAKFTHLCMASFQIPGVGANICSSLFVHY